jgi:hypothetical protein
MILAWLIPYEASRPHDGLLRNPRPALKKKYFALNNRVFAGVLLLITSRNRFAGRKNSPDKGDTRPLPKTAKYVRKSQKLTTSHVFRPTQRRKAALLLPSWLRNLDFLNSKCNGFDGGGGGVGQMQSGESFAPISSHRNFPPKARPPLPCFGQKKRAARARRNTEPARPALSHELVAPH